MSATGHPDPFPRAVANNNEKLMTGETMQSGYPAALNNVMVVMLEALTADVFMQFENGGDKVKLDKVPLLSQHCSKRGMDVERVALASWIMSNAKNPDNFAAGEIENRDGVALTDEEFISRLKAHIGVFEEYLAEKKSEKNAGA